MNEQIDKLIKQATIRVNNPIVNSRGKIICDDWEEGVSMSKFAELIIKECTDIALKSGSIHNKSEQAKAESERIYQKIKEHFGVE